jgi:hypothetical protein
VTKRTHWIDVQNAYPDFRIRIERCYDPGERDRLDITVTLTDEEVRELYQKLEEEIYRRDDVTRSDERPK